MRGSLGEKIGEGGSADIHAWAPGQVVKLFKPGGEWREVFDEVTLEGRFGIVLSRLDGPTLLQLLRTRAMTPEQRHRVLQCCR